MNPNSESLSAGMEEPLDHSCVVVETEEARAEATTGNDMAASAPLRCTWQRCIVAFMNGVVVFLACLPQTLLQVSPVLIGLALVVLADILLSVSICLRREWKGRTGSARMHWIAFASILIIQSFIMICLAARWYRNFQKDGAKHKEDEEAGCAGQTVPKEAKKNAEDSIESGPGPELNSLVENVKDEDCIGEPERGEATRSVAESIESIVDPAGDRDAQADLHGFILSKTKKYCLFLFIPLVLALLVLTELVFVSEMRRNSFIPLDPNQNALNPNSKYVPDECDMQSRWDQAVAFFNGSVVVEDVMLIYVNFTMSDAGAFEIDNTVYFPKKDWSWCPSVDLLVHELVHVWQEQSGYFFGPGAPGRAIRMTLDRWRCSWCLYDYGGREGVVSAMESALAGDQAMANVVTAFGAEQMAEIVEDYYWYKVDLRYCDPVDHGLSFGEAGYNETSNVTYVSRYNMTDEVKLPINETDDISVFDDDWHVEHYGEYCQALEFYACQIINC